MDYKRQLIHFHAGIDEVHFVEGNADLTLCGQDIIGDKEYEQAVDTNKPVNCEYCLSLVRLCKSIRLKKPERKK